MSDLKGILLDSGRVLNFAATGSWSYSPNFFQITGKEKFNKIPEKKRKAAFDKAWKYISSIKIMSTMEEEYQHFLKFFAIIAEELPELEIDDIKRKALTEDFVFNFDKYTFFKDVFEVLPKLGQKYKLCLVSDAWPSLRGVFQKAGVDKYFDSIIISSELGVSKPNEQMYQAALKALGLKENEVIFVDDNPVNCDGASKLGIRAVVLNRDLATRLYCRYVLKASYKVVKNLHALEKVI